jgi:hypothetical protein
MRMIRIFKLPVEKAKQAIKDGLIKKTLDTLMATLNLRRLTSDRRRASAAA